MTFDDAFINAVGELEEKYSSFDSLVYFDLQVQSIPKGRYKPYVCYALTEEDSILVYEFLVVLIRKDDKDDVPQFIYTTYDQSLGKNGIYRFI